MSKYIKNWFSNFKRCETPIIVEEIKYWTVENFYQAMKFKSKEDRLRISKLTPGEAKREGKKANFDNSEPWMATGFNKLRTMEFALKHKFKKGTIWQIRLINTEGDIIEHNNWGDKFWGQVDGEGQNHLGKILMKIRDRQKVGYTV